MTLRELLSSIAGSYDRSAGTGDHPAQLLLRSAADHVGQYVPAGYLVSGSGGKGNAATIPWISVFNPDETTTAQRGIYVVFLFSENLASIALSLAQGVTEHERELGRQEARKRLREDSRTIRGEIFESARASDWLSEFTLGSKAGLARSYEAGCIACRVYDASQLPSDDELSRDLSEVLGLYDHAIAAKRRLLIERPAALASSASAGPSEAVAESDPFLDFKPKSSDDYVTHIRGRTIRKTRRHEKLVEDYAEWAKGQGFDPATPHPEDLMLRRAGELWLVEAKVLYRGNAQNAVRAAVGQLLTYSWFIAHERAPTLVALFSEPIGSGFVEFLDGHSISAVWHEDGAWIGSPSAQRDGTAARP